MKSQHFKFANYRELDAALLPKLRDRIFHVTTPDAYAEITKAGNIVANAVGQYPMTCTQSEGSYFRKCGCVSLVDLRNISPADLDLGMKKYYFPQPVQGNKAIFLVLSPKAYARVIRPEGVGVKEMLVPEFEVGYRDSIPLSLIEEVISIEVAEQPNPLGLME